MKKIALIVVSMAMVSLFCSNAFAKYGKMAVVAKTGGDYTDPIAAMNNLASWCGTPSETNPCLLKLMPGVYDLGSNSLTMQSYVDLEGSGENATKITGTDYVLFGATNSEIRSLTVESTAAQNASHAIYNYNESPRITNVTTHGWIYNYGASTVIKNCTINALWRGIIVEGPTASQVIENSTIQVSDGWDGGIRAYGQDVTVRNSQISVSAGAGINNTGGGGTFHISNSVIQSPSNTLDLQNGGSAYVFSSRLEGGSVLGSVTCAGVVDGNFVFFANTCP